MPNEMKIVFGENNCENVMLTKVLKICSINYEFVTKFICYKG